MDPDEKRTLIAWIVTAIIFVFMVWLTIDTLGSH